MRTASLIALFALPLAGCAATGSDGFPSLSRRAVEAGRTVGEGEAPVQPGQGAQADPELVKTLDALGQQVRRGEAAFDTLYDQVAGTIRVSTSAQVSSEQWVVAHVDLGRLEHARYDSVYALAGLDRLYIDRMRDIAGGKAAGGIDEIQAVRIPALALVANQNDRIDALRAVLREP